MTVFGTQWGIVDQESRFPLILEQDSVSKSWGKKRDARCYLTYLFEPARATTVTHGFCRLLSGGMDF
jgi:hypothetical protein